MYYTSLIYDKKIFVRPIILLPRCLMRHLTMRVIIGVMNSVVRMNT